MSDRPHLGYAGRCAVRMMPLAVLALATFVIALAFLAWRERARTLAEAERLRAEAERARHVESIAADAANLLAAVSQSLLLARDDDQEPGEAKQWIDAAYESTRSTIALFEAARVEVLGAPTIGDGSSAEGIFRLAVAIARSEGSGILLESDPCELEIAGSGDGVVGALVGALGSIHAVVRKPGFITVRIGSEDVSITAPIERAPALDRLERAMRRAGWALEVRHRDEELDLSLRPAPRSGEPSEDERAPSALQQRGGTA